MISFLVIVEALLLAAAACFTASFVISSIREGERQAACVSSALLAALLGAVAALLALDKAGVFKTAGGFAVLLAGFVLMAGATVLVLRRSGPNQRAIEGTRGYIVGEVERVDEREIVFARNRSLPPDSEPYRAFYSRHPQWEAGDAERRKRGGPLGNPGSLDKPGERPNVAALFSTFAIPQSLGSPEIVRPTQHPHFRGETLSLSPAEATVRVKGFARHLGADIVGVSEINPLWIYAARGEIHYGNWEQWGEAIQCEHPYAVVFAMEMSREMVWAAPHTPSMVESGTVYARGAFIATQLAAFIANLGYSATANHLRHYDVLLVPAAVDAGLGEVGRFGYLITKEFGPRVRLGCVTTDLPLVPDRPVDHGVEDFCRICRKCARTCPSRSIPFGDPAEANGTIRWKLNAETCFDYWGKVGTDCNICMRVCPWSHPRTLPHRLIIGLVARNHLARRFFSPLDDLFYGRKPSPRFDRAWAAFR